MEKQEISKRYWEKLYKDPKRVAAYNKRRRNKAAEERALKEKQKLKADEILRKIGLSRTEKYCTGLSRTEKYCTGGSNCFCATCKGEI